MSKISKVRSPSSIPFSILAASTQPKPTKNKVQMPRTVRLSIPERAEEDYKSENSKNLAFSTLKENNNTGKIIVNSKNKIELNNFNEIKNGQDGRPTKKEIDFYIKKLEYNEKSTCKPEDVTRLISGQNENAFGRSAANYEETKKSPLIKDSDSLKNRTNIQDYDIKKLKLLQESFYKKLEEHNESNKSISRKNIDNTSCKVSHIPSDTVIKRDFINRSPFEHKRNKSTFETPLNTNQKNNSIIKNNEESDFKVYDRGLQENFKNPGKTASNQEFEKISNILNSRIDQNKLNFLTTNLSLFKNQYNQSKNANEESVKNKREFEMSLPYKKEELSNRYENNIKNEDMERTHEVIRNNFFNNNGEQRKKSQSIHCNSNYSQEKNSYSQTLKFQNLQTAAKQKINEIMALAQLHTKEKNKRNSDEEMPFAVINLDGKSENDKKNEIPMSFINQSNLRNLKLASPKVPLQEYEASSVHKMAFDFKYVIGKGGFGKVYKVEHKKSRVLYAMKEMLKSKVISKRSVNSVMNERELLSMIKHPFIVNMVFAFQDRETLYLVMDLMTGGDLRYHIGRQRRFSEAQTKFFVACIVTGLEYLHDKNIIHRDIKPENLVLDKNGYVRITDMGIARMWKLENNGDTSGTPGYMAPEVMCRQNHTIAVDYFALGVLAYEFMLGRRPYLGRSRKEIRDAILAKQEQIKKQDVPEGWSLEAADFINRLIQRKPNNRLGMNGPREVKQHAWLRNFPWDKLYKKEIIAPFKPNPKADNFDHKQQISETDNTSEDLIQQNLILLRRNSVQKLFAGYGHEGTFLLKEEEGNKGRSRSTSIGFSKMTTNDTNS